MWLDSPSHHIEKNKGIQNNPMGGKERGGPILLLHIRCLVDFVIGLTSLVGEAWGFDWSKSRSTMFFQSIGKIYQLLVGCISNTYFKNGLLCNNINCQ
jgi:hypothetical protein